MAAQKRSAPRALKCTDGCGATINPKTYRCDYCGTYYEMPAAARRYETWTDESKYTDNMTTMCMSGYLTTF
jgi:hypothetical protein